MKLALIQMKVGADKAKNIAHARELIKQAASHNAQLICLPVKLIYQYSYVLTHKY